MRISFTLQSGESLLTLNDKQEQIDQASRSIASGVKFSSPADDPYAWSQAMNVKQGLREYSSVMNNITYASGFQQATDSALSKLSDMLTQAHQTAISATSATGSDQKTALATQLDGILKQALNLANSQYQDQYVFAGTKTGAAPFTIDASGNVSYNGDSGDIKVRTDRSVVTGGGSTIINLSGNDPLFGAGGLSNVLQQISDLKQAITSGNSSTIATKMTTLEDAFNNINTASAANGSRLSALDNQKSAVGVFQTNGQSDLSTLQDTDIAEATTKLQQAQTAFQAALQVTSILQKLNLSNYLSGTA